VDQQGMLQRLAFLDTAYIFLVGRSDIADGMGSLGLSDNDSDADSCAATICSKDDSKYSDSNCDSDDKDDMIQEFGYDPDNVRKRDECVIL
jgi:hypothetical protein